MAADGYYIYTGGEAIIPPGVTRVRIDESLTVIPAGAFYKNRHIEEVECHVDVIKVEEEAFAYCPSLRRLIMPGVRVVEERAFANCKALAIVECDKLERIGDHAFNCCKSLRSINLPSAKIVEDSAFAECYALADVECGKLEIIEGEAFYDCRSLRIIDLPSAKIVGSFAFTECEDLTNVKFGKKLERIGGYAFSRCTSLERITIPLKDGMITENDIFQDCYNLERVNLVEGAVLRDTIAALLSEEWRNDMDVEIGAIDQSLPTARAGGCGDDDVGEKARAIRMWIRSVLRNIVHYKAQHHSILNEAATTLQLALPNDIVLNNILPFAFREMPSYTFEGEDCEEQEDEGDVNDLGIELLLELGEEE